MELPLWRSIAYNAGMVRATSLRDLAGGVEGETHAQRLYREDGYGWAMEQADALRRRDVDAIDWENVSEEIESVGKSEKREWTSYCRQAIVHLVKIEHYAGASDEALSGWAREVQDYRDHMADILRENPTLRHECPQMFAAAWRRGRLEAARKLAAYEEQAGAKGRLSQARVRRWRRMLPADSPYSLKDVAGCDPFEKEAEPGDDVWPEPVARKLNEGLGADYPVPYHPLERGSGRSR